MRLSSAILAIALCFASKALLAQSVPAAIYTDPAPDPKYPASATVLHIPSHGVLINGLLYSPPGAGPHPTLVICHGLPGNEKNLDLAQAVRRAGWNAVTFNYRGSWGSPGSFRFAQNIEDGAAVLAYLKDPANAAKLGIDPKRIVIAGHSMGGWVAVHTAANDPSLLGVILISMADMSHLADRPSAEVQKEMADDMESLSGVTAQSMVEDLKAHTKPFVLSEAAPKLKNMPVLVLTSND